MTIEYSAKQWNYAVTPGFVIRFQDEIFQKRHLETGEWFESDDPTLLRQIAEDGKPLSENEAEGVFAAMQKRHRNLQEK